MGGDSNSDHGEMECPAAHPPEMITQTECVIMWTMAPKISRFRQG